MDSGKDSTVYFDRYVVEKTLGEGSYGKVKLGRDMATNELVLETFTHH